MAEDDVPILPKPNELLALHSVTAELFGILREWFDVPDEVTIDLREIDSAVLELGDHVMIAAMAMRKLQALHLLSTPGVLTTTDVVVSIIGDLDRALVQAPNMHLKRAAHDTDWDAELALLDVDLGDDQRSEPGSRADHPSALLDGDESQDADGTADEIEGDQLDPADLELVQTLIEIGVLEGISELDDDDVDTDDSDRDGDEWLVIEYVDSEDLDEKIDHFRGLHSLLHEAVRGVLEASQGEIRYFV